MGWGKGFKIKLTDKNQKKKKPNPQEKDVGEVGGKDGSSKERKRRN